MDEIRFMMDVNLMGTFHMIKAALPSIKKWSHRGFRFFFFLPNLRLGFDFCQFWVVGDGCRCAGVGDLAGCGVACQGGGGFFVHFGGVGVCFIYLFIFLC